MAIRIEAISPDRARALGEGSMTIYEAAADKPPLLDALARAREIEIDLSAVREMDTAGLQLLVLAKRESIKAGKTLRLAAHSPASLDVVERYNLAAYFGAPMVASPLRKRASRSRSRKRGRS